MKLKSFLAALLGALILLTAFPISAFAAKRTPFGFIDELVDDDDTQFISSHEEALERIYESFINHDSEINIYDFSIPVSDFHSLFSAALGVYPEIFFVDLNNIPGTQYNGCLYTVNPTYLYPKAKTDEMLAAFYAKADEYLAYIDDSMDDFTKAVVLHDRLAIENEYSINAPDGSGEHSTNYTFMVKGWGRCENYAECYAYLLAQEGIKSEIINSDSMVHEWMKIKLDGDEYYYNVDLTWDDPLVNDLDRPGQVSHGYFLLSDDEIMTSDSDEGRNQAHYDFEYLNDSANTYDEYDNLHNLEYPLFYIGGKLYTLYEKDNKGYIATYNHADDSLADVVEIDDIWYAGQYSYWPGCFSGIGEHNGLLYFNGENCVYVFDPATGEKYTYIPDAVENQLYGLYVKDGKIIGLAADTPNDDADEVELGDCIENIVYFRSGTDSTAIFKDDNQLELPENTFTAPEDKVFGGWTDEDGNTYAAGETITLDKHSSTFTAKWLGYYDIAIPASENGAVSVENTTVLEGSEVELTVSPDEMCELTGLTVTDANNEEIQVNNNKFIMPASGVTVTAEFRSPFRQSFTATSDTDSNITKFFNTASKTFGSFELLGIQEKAGNTRSLRFFTVVNSEILASDKVEDYGYIFTLSQKSTAEALPNVGKLNLDNTKHYYSCKDTYNTFCDGGYGSADYTSTDYKYVTASVNDFPDNGATICARFYVKLKSGTVLYANYTDYDGCAFNFDETV